MAEDNNESEKTAMERYREQYQAQQQQTGEPSAATDSGPDLNLQTNITAKTFHPAGFWLRFGAAMIDGMIINIVTIPAALLLKPLLRTLGFSELIASLLTIPVGLIATFFFAGYFYSTRGATPGKMVLGLKVLNDENGTYPSFIASGFRDTLGKYLSIVVLGIGYLMVAFRSDKRGLHDLIFNTQVVKK